jgi:hypothetical protein
MFSCNDFIFGTFVFFMMAIRTRPNGLTLTCVHVGVDSAWEQKKLEATSREMLAAGAAEFHTVCPATDGSVKESSACFVRQF